MMGYFLEDDTTTALPDYEYDSTDVALAGKFIIQTIKSPLTQSKDKVEK